MKKTMVLFVVVMARLAIVAPVVAAVDSFLVVSLLTMLLRPRCVNAMPISSLLSERYFFFLEQEGFIFLTLFEKIAFHSPPPMRLCRKKSSLT